jgi:hypothetical protein
MSGHWYYPQEPWIGGDRVHQRLVDIERRLAALETRLPLPPLPQRVGNYTTVEEQLQEQERARGLPVAVPYMALPPGVQPAMQNVVQHPGPAEIAALVAAAKDAARIFDIYAQHHAAKTPPDTDKAALNRLEADALRAALAPFEKVRTDGE